MNFGIPERYHHRRSRQSSNRSKQSSHLNECSTSPQIIAGSRIDEAKLVRLLDDRFGSSYKLQVRF